MVYHWPRRNEGSKPRRNSKAKHIIDSSKELQLIEFLLQVRTLSLVVMFLTLPTGGC